MREAVLGEGAALTSDTATPAALASAGARRAGFRPDVDGLRAVAILMVVAYHVSTVAVPGGFVGVDVFFVISGFLITGKLLGELASTANVRLRSFWAGRVRRLVPALALMVAVVLVASLFVLGPDEWRRAANEGIASLLYVSNLVFAVQATKYFAADVNSSLFLHTWSLGVEEQFYLVWPVLLMFVGWLVPRRRSSTRTVAVLLGAILVGSFALAVALTSRGSPWSFFSLPTRAWEFAVGGLLACAARRAMPGPARSHALLGFAGLAAVLLSAFVLSDATPSPGVATLLPVLGTAALLHSGDGRAPSPVASLLSHRPAQWLGRVSYAWYLWHWPVMLLAVAWVDRDAVGVRAAGVIVALGIAWGARRLVENPIRFSPALVGRPGRTFAVGASITVVALVVAFAVRADAQHKLTEPFYARLLDAGAGAGNQNDDAVCETNRSPRGIRYCAYGDLSGTTTVMLVGDSHAVHWIPAFDRAAKALGLRLVVHTRGGCPSVPALVGSGAALRVPNGSCFDHRRETQQLIEEMHPNAIVLANTDYLGRTLTDGGLPDEAEQLRLWNQALATQLDDLQGRGDRVGLILDNPSLADDPNICMARKLSIPDCTPSRAEALATTGPFNEGQLATLAGRPPVPTLDVTPTLCDADHCALERDGVLVYHDKNHLTPEFVLTQVPAVTTFLRELEPTSG